MYNFKNKKFITVTLTIVVILIVLILFSLSGNKYGKQVKIINLSEYTSSKPTNKDSIDYIQHLLHIAIEDNTDDQESIKNIRDAKVRPDSFSQTHDKDRGIHSVELIVDIESIKKSFNVNYQWADNEDGQIDQYGNSISCLPSDQLIYGEFDCVDTSTLMRGSSDPVLLVNWATGLDNYNNSIDEQLEPFEKYFIEYQILGDFRKNNKLRFLDVETEIDGVDRDVRGGNNKLSFKLTVDKKSIYSVSINYDDGRLTKITNQETGKTIVERRTEFVD